MYQAGSALARVCIAPAPGPSHGVSRRVAVTHIVPGSRLGLDDSLDDGNCL